MKIKKKIVIFILILSIFSAALTPPKKTEAASVALGYAAFKIGVSFTAFATYATWFYANGYTMPVQELITAFANKYYDYSMGVYVEKPTKLNVLEKFNLYTSAVLTGNVANIPNAHDLQEIVNDISEEWPQKIDITTIGEYTLANGYLGKNSTLMEWIDNGFAQFTNQYKDKIFKIQINSYPAYYVYLNTANVAWNEHNSYYFPTVQVVYPDGFVTNIPLTRRDGYFSLQTNMSDETLSMRYMVGSSVIFETPTRKLDLLNGMTYGTLPNSYASGHDSFDMPYPVYYPALNSKAATADELLGLMNVDEYLQREIAKMIEEQDRTKERPLVLPTIEAGKVVYPGTQSGTDEGDTPGTGIDVPTGWWDRVLDIPRDITTGLTTWWDNTLMPGLDTIKDKITEIPTSITNITDLTQEIEMDQIDFTRLKLDGIITKFPFSIPFDYVKLLKNFKRDPIVPDLKIKLNTHYFNIDHDIGTASMNKYIVFFRWFSLTIFVYALMMITRKVIKW